MRKKSLSKPFCNDVFIYFTICSLNSLNFKHLFLYLRTLYSSFLNVYHSSLFHINKNKNLTFKLQLNQSKNSYFVIFIMSYNRSHTHRSSNGHRSSRDEIPEYFLPNSVPVQHEWDTILGNSSAGYHYGSSGSMPSLTLPNNVPEQHRLNEQAKRSKKSSKGRKSSSRNRDPNTSGMSDLVLPNNVQTQHSVDRHYRHRRYGDSDKEN